MTVDDGDRIRVRNAHMVRLDPDHLSILLVCIVDRQVALSTTGLEEKPEIGEGSREWCGDVLDLPVADVWQDIVEHREEEDGVRRKQNRQEHREGRA